MLRRIALLVPLLITQLEARLRSRIIDEAPSRLATKSGQFASKEKAMRNFMRTLAFLAVLSLAYLLAPSGASAAARADHSSGGYVAVSYPRQTSSSTSSKSTAHKRRRRRRRTNRMQLPKGPTPERISEIQTALSRKGYYQGDPTGKWDSSTVDAVEKFQSANHIDSTGKLDAPTLQKLGLGSDIAGVSAPKPVMPNASVPAAIAPSTPGVTSASNAAASGASQHGGASSAAAVAPSSSSAATIAASPAGEDKPQH